MLMINAQPSNLSICAPPKIAWGWICWTVKTFYCVAVEVLTWFSSDWSDVSAWLTIQDSRHFSLSLQRCWMVAVEAFQISFCLCSWKPIKVPGSYSVPFCLSTEMKIFGQKNVKLIGRYVFNCSRLFQWLFQNFLHAFKSLLVLYWVFFDFCSCKNFSISTSSLLAASSGRLKFASVCSFYLPASSWRSTDSCI